MYYLLSAVQNQSRYELLLRGRIELGVGPICHDGEEEEAKQTHTVNNRFVTQPSCLYLGTTRVTSRRNALLPLPVTSYCLHGDRLAPAYEPADLHPKSVARKEGMSAIVARPYWYAAADSTNICCGQYHTKYSPTG